MQPQFNLNLFNSTHPVAFFELIVGNEQLQFALTIDGPTDDRMGIQETLEGMFNVLSEVHYVPDTLQILEPQPLYSGTLNHDIQLVDFAFGWCASLQAYIPQVVFGKDLGADATSTTIQTYVGSSVMAYEYIAAVPDVVEIPATDEKPAGQAVRGFTLNDVSDGTTIELATVHFNEYVDDANIVVLLGNGTDRIVAFVKAYNSTFLTDVVEFLKIGLYKTNLAHLIVLAYGSTIRVTRPFVTDDQTGKSYISTKLLLSRRTALGETVHPLADVFIPTEANEGMRFVPAEGLGVDYSGYAGWFGQALNAGLAMYNISQFIPDSQPELDCTFGDDYNLLDSTQLENSAVSEIQLTALRVELTVGETTEQFVSLLPVEYLTYPNLDEPSEDQWSINESRVVVLPQHGLTAEGVPSVLLTEPVTLTVSLNGSFNVATATLNVAGEVTSTIGHVTPMHYTVAYRVETLPEPDNETVDDAIPDTAVLH